MNEVLDPLYHAPFATGFLVVLALCEVGVFLRLREEWMAALAVAHVSAAGTLVAAALHVAAGVGALLGALGAVSLKQFSRQNGNATYVFMYLAGWGLLMLVAANTTLGHALGRALLDGQIYFTGTTELAMSIVVLAALLIASKWFARRLLRARLAPSYERANSLPAWRWHLGFDIAVAVVLALSIATVGVVAAFSLVFIPAWIGFRFASSWRTCRRYTYVVGGVSYVLAFALCLILDQPFGPVIVVVLLTAMPVCWLVCLVSSKSTAG